MCLFKCNPVSLSTCAPFPCICKCLSNLYVCLNPPKKDREKKTCLLRTPVQIVELLHFIGAYDRCLFLFGTLCLYPPLPTRVQHAEIREGRFWKTGLLSFCSSSKFNREVKLFFSPSKPADSLSTFFSQPSGTPRSLLYLQEVVAFTFWLPGKHQFVVWTALT